MASRSYEQAALAIKEGLRTDPENFELNMLLARVYSRTERRAEAIAVLEKTREKRPDDPAPYFLLAEIHLYENDTDTAISVYEDMAVRFPENPMAANNLAALLTRKGLDLERAREIAERLRRRYPQNAVIADTHGWACYRSGETDSALDSLSFAAKRLAQNPSVRYHYGMALAKAGDIEEAVRQIENALSLSPDFREAASARAVLTRLKAEG
jgi:predicted Zn-dependent protease